MVNKPLIRLRNEQLEVVFLHDTFFASPNEQRHMKKRGFPAKKHVDNNNIAIKHKTTD